MSFMSSRSFQPVGCLGMGRWGDLKQADPLPEILSSSHS